MNHSAPHHLKPPGVFAHAAALAMTLGTLNVYLSGRLSERKIGRAETNRNVRLKECFKELIYCPSSIRKTDVFINHQAFYLMEHRCMCEIRIAAVYPPRTNDADRRLLILHSAYLDRRGVCTQYMIVIDIKGIVHRPGRVMRRNIEGAEVVVIIFYLGTHFHAVTYRCEDFLNTLQCTGDRMQATGMLPSSGQRDIHHLIGQFCRYLCLLQSRFTLSNSLLDFIFGLIDFCSSRRTLFR